MAIVVITHWKGDYQQALAIGREAARDLEAAWRHVLPFSATCRWSDGPAWVAGQPPREPAVVASRVLPPVGV